MPWDAVLTGIEKLLHWFSPRFMFFLLLFSASLFFIPTRWAAYLGLESWIAGHRAWLAGAMILSSAYLIPFGISPIVERKLVSRSASSKLAELMGELAEDEKRFLRGFYFPKRTGHLLVWPHEVGRLESIGVVFCPGDSGLSNKQKIYSLTEKASTYISKHKEFVAELERVNPNPFA